MRRDVFLLLLFAGWVFPFLWLCWQSGYTGDWRYTAAAALWYAVPVVLIVTFTPD